MLLFSVNTIACLNGSNLTSHITLVIHYVCSIYLGEINVFYEFCKNKGKKALVYFEINWTGIMLLLFIINICYVLWLCRLT